MTKISCLLFDLDGTLLDSRESIIDAMQAIVQQYLPSITHDELMKCFGESFDDFYHRTSEQLPENVTREQLFNTYLKSMNSYHSGMLRLFPSVGEGLVQLKLSGYQLGVVTNKQRKFVLEGLENSGILDLFETIVCVDDVTLGKPSSEPILKAMDALGVRPNQTMMIGDSRYDVLAARAAHVQSALMEWYGQDKSQELLPDYCFRNFDEFLKNIKLYQNEKSVG